MTNRLTPEALDALLAEHTGSRPRSCGCDAQVCRPDCGKEIVCRCGKSLPCTLYLLASEVRDAREAAKPKKCPGCAVDVPAALDAHLPECSVRQWHEAMDDVEFDDE